MSITKTKLAIGLGMFLGAGLGGLAAANSPASMFDDPPPRTPDQRCSTGGVNKTFGATQWLVFSCGDNQTLVFLSAPGSPADPYYFAVYPDGPDYHVFGEGTGDREATDAAFKEIELFTTADIRSLIDETKSARHK